MKPKYIPEKYSSILDWLSSLSYREVQILTLRYQRKNLDEVGQLFGITKERVRQLEDRALKLADEHLGAYLENNK